jgi:hypothetical protein
MEFCIPWQNWNIEDIQYGIYQNNTRIENGFFVPIYFADKYVKCQAFHLMTPELTINETDLTHETNYLHFKIPKNSDFEKKIREFDLRNLSEAEKFKEIDLKNKENVEAKQKLESQLFQIKNEIATTYKDKISDNMKSMIDIYIKEIDTWLDNNPNSEKSEYDNKVSELESKFKEFVSVYEKGTGPKETPIGSEDDDGPGPQIEEID